MGVWFSRHVYIPGLPRQDQTAMGVAKIRLTESRFPADQRLFMDPYAKNFVIGAWIMQLFRASTMEKMFQQHMPGLYSLIVARTRFLDDVCVEADCTQMVILGAGYDTRGLRLGLDVPCFEVDQPGVHVLKKAGLDDLSLNEEVRNQVHLVSVNFNQESVGEKLLEQAAFQKGAKTVVLMEGVSQYIPKESTAETLNQIQGLVGQGSILGITYVNEAAFDKDPAVVEQEIGSSATNLANLFQQVTSVGEPWITGWSQTGFASFLEEHSFRVLEDVTVSNLEERYFKPVGRSSEPSLGIERFVKAERV